jgi:hypothetical protein
LRFDTGVPGGGIVLTRAVHDCAPPQPSPRRATVAIPIDDLDAVRVPLDEPLDALAHQLQYVEG